MTSSQIIEILSFLFISLLYYRSMNKANKELKRLTKYTEALKQTVNDLQTSNDELLIYALNKILQECIDAEDYKNAIDCRNLLEKLNRRKDNAKKV